MRLVITLPNSSFELYLGLGTEIWFQYGTTGSYTTGADRTKTQRIFRCFHSVPEPNENEKKYFIELLW